MNTFRVGQTVVCVVTFPAEYTTKYKIKCPIKGNVYTVRELLPIPDGPGLRLVEIVNPAQWFRLSIASPESERIFAEVVWMQNYFHPVAKTDISVFKEMLVETALVAS